MDVFAYARFFRRRRRRTSAHRAAVAPRRTISPRPELLESRDLPSGLALPLSGGGGLLPSLPPFANTGTGLLGHYFRTPGLSGEVLTRTDAEVNFTWTGVTPAPSVPQHNFSVRWTGEVQALFSEVYTFSTRSDDGVRLWVDGRPLIDDWHDHSGKEDAGAVVLRAGRKYDIVVEYYENPSGPAFVQLSWSSASQPKEIVPETHLYPGPPAPGGLSGFVYADADGDGVRGPGESGSVGVSVTLTGTDDEGDRISLATTTAADGSYHFTDLRPGFYTVEATSSAEGRAKDGAGAAPVVLTLRAGAVLTDVDFGEPVPAAPPTPPPLPPSPSALGGPDENGSVPPAPPPVARHPAGGSEKPVPIPSPSGEENNSTEQAPAAPAAPQHTAPVVAAAPIRSSPRQDGGGAGAVPDPDQPTVPVQPPAADGPPETRGTVPPPNPLEEEEPVEVPAHAAADVVFIALGAGPERKNDLFGGAVPPPSRRPAGQPPLGGANSVEERALLVSAWLLTTVGAAAANPPDQSRKHSES